MTLVRVALTIALLCAVRRESGPWTTTTLALIAGYCEMNEARMKRRSAQADAALEKKA